MRSVALFALAALTACTSNLSLPLRGPFPTSAPPAPPSGEPVAHEEVDYGADGTTLVRTKEVLVYPGGKRARHGREVEWYADGTKRFERYFDHGEPAGVWQSWFEDGTRRSEVHCGEESGTTTWWYEDGRVAARGPSIRGAPDGMWAFWHEDGAIAEEGRMAGGLRVGEWNAWYASGSQRARGHYRNGVRVGEWLSWTPEGELVETPLEPAPPDAPEDP